MSNKDKLLESAQKFLQKGQVAKAIKDYQKVVEIDPRDVRNRQKLAELYGRERRNEEALETYEGVAKHYFENGFYLKAIAVYKQMQKIDANRVSIYHRLAELNEKQGLIGNALAEYRNLVAYYEKSQMLPEAIKVLQKMKDLEPENLNIRVKIAETYAGLGLKEKSREEFRDILNFLHKKQDFARILKLYEIFLPHYPEDLELRIGQAEAHIERGEVDHGLELLKGLLKGRPDHAELLLALAGGYRKKGDFENERLTYQHLLKTAPEELEYREGFIHACLDQGDFRRALEELEEVKEVFFAVGKVSLLKTIYERLRQDLTGDERVLQTLHSIYELTGEGEKLFDLMSAGSPRSALPSDDGVRSPKELLDESILEDAVEDVEELATPEEMVVESVAGPVTGKADQDDLEEISLDFLELEEDRASSAAIPALLPAGVTAESAEPAEDDEFNLNLDLELELELDLDLDLEEGPAVTVESVGPVTVLEEGLSLGLLDLKAEVLPETDQGLLDTDLLEWVDEEEPLALVDEEELFELEPEPAAVQVAVRDLRRDLEEVEFYVQQGLFAEAERTCQALLAEFPDCQEARSKLAEIGLRQQSETPIAEYFDFAGEVLDEERSEAEVLAGEAGPFRLDGVFSETSGVVEGQIDLEDAESHYNLGIAYKEMGLFDDAIAEFEKAGRSPSRLQDSLTLQGMCLAEKGAFPEAEQAFLAGLGHPRLSIDERISLQYELGLLYEGWGRPEQALQAYNQVAGNDRFFRDVGEKIEALRRKLGLGNDATGADGAGGGGKNRVSYL